MDKITKEPYIWKQLRYNTIEMRTIFESIITVIVAVLGLILSIIWYRAEYEIEPLIGIITCAGLLVTNIVYRFFPEEAPTPTNKNMIIDSEVKAANIIVGDNNDIKIQHILGNLEDYQNLEQALQEDRKLLRISDNLEVQEIISARINKNEEKREGIKKAIEGAFGYISKLTISTERLDQAKALFLEGDIPGALEILKDEAIQTDYLVLQTAKQSEEERHSRRMEEIAEKTKGIAEEWKMKAVLMATRYEDEEWFKKTKGYYEKALEVDRDVDYIFTYAVFLQDHNQYNEATPLYLEALERYRSLGQSNPQVFLPSIAATLGNLAGLHRKKNELEQAEAKFVEALGIYRFLAQSYPHLYLSDVAGTLNNLGLLHHAKNELEQAELEFSEALKMFRTLAQSNPQAYLPHVAHALNNLAILHREKEKLEQAEVEYAEVLSMYRYLAQSNPYAFLPGVAAALNNLAILHRDKNMLEQAELEFFEALGMYRFVAQSNPQVFLPDLGMTLTNLANLHGEKKEFEQAEAEFVEALDIYRFLAQSNPQVFLPDLANTASNLAVFYHKYLPDRGKSLELVAEALKAAIPFRGYLKYAQDSIERAKAVIKKWGLDVNEFLIDFEQ